MKLASLCAAALLAMAGVAYADAHAMFEKVDADADGQVTLEEGMKVHTDWTEDAFKTLDADGSGGLSKEEYETAMKKMKK